MRKSSAILFALFAANAFSAPAARVVPIKPMGPAASFGMRVFYPGEVNDYLAHVYQAMAEGERVADDFGMSALFLSYSVRGRGLFPITARQSLEPFLQYFIAPKVMTLTGDIEKLVWVFLTGYQPGANWWYKFNPEKRITFKAGAGAFYSWNSLNISGDLGDEGFSGSGGGVQALIGMDITFRKLAINLDGGFVYGSSSLGDHEGALNVDLPDKPARLNLTGFEFRPGITFHY
jgi:hypothetical protein